MDKLSEKITGMLNSGQSAIDISEYFGGIIPMLKKCKQDPQLIGFRHIFLLVLLS